MSFGDESGLGYDADTARGREWPSVRQFNVFLGNRLGALLDLVRRFEQTDVRVVSLTVVETADCAIIRLVPSDYERGYEILTNAKFAFTESDLLVVKLPDDDRPLLTITKAMLERRDQHLLHVPASDRRRPDGQHGHRGLRRRPRRRGRGARRPGLHAVHRKRFEGVSLLGPRSSRPRVQERSGRPRSQVILETPAASRGGSPAPLCGRPR